jgi:membrane associated rhomboid family serine protease
MQADAQSFKALKAVREGVARRLLTIGAMVVLLWALELLDFALWSVDLDRYGIRPRTLAGLLNIGFAPFLHYGFGHLMANTAPFVVLGWCVIAYSIYDFWIVSLFATLVSGLGVWLFGAPHTLHLGLSGVIFGYLGFLLARGLFERSLLALALAVIAFLFYGGMLWGLLPIWPGMSWSGHLFGFIGGILAASWLTTYDIP